MSEIRYVERTTQAVELEKVYGHKSLSLLYGESKMARFFSFCLLPFLAQFPFFSHFYGFLQRRKISCRKIRPFIEAFGVDSSEFAEPIESFRSFNDFFIRKLKPQARPIDQNPNSAILPADGRYLVFPHLHQIDHFYVKQKAFDLFSFLQDPVLARRFSKGSMVIARLCPTDYHRFHFCSSGVAEKPRPISGALYSVSPFALRRRFSILSENKRMVTEFDTEPFGTILYVEIGATCVGTIHQTYNFKKPVQKGGEKGFFSFGGSCIVLIFEEGAIQFDEDLIRQSSRMLETKGNFGQSLGISLRKNKPKNRVL